MNGKIMCGIVILSCMLFVVSCGSAGTDSRKDGTAPVITAFSLTSGTPATDPVITFTLEGSDNVGITAWLINENPATPSAEGPAWVASRPVSYTVTSGFGEKEVYAWAKDAAGNISTSGSLSVDYIVPAQDIVLVGTVGRIDMISLFWDTPVISGYAITGYKIIRSDEGGTPTDSAAYATDDASPFADVALPENYTDYYYRVAAMHDDIVVAYSNEVVASSVDVTEVIDYDYIFVDVNYTGGGNDGSSEKPFNTIEEGYSAVTSDADGGVILIRDGAYSVSAAITLSYPVEIRSETGSYEYSGVVLNGGANVVSAIIVGNTADASVIRGLTITNYARGSSSSGIIHVLGGADNVQIVNNYLHDNLGVNIGKSDSTATAGMVISGNKIYNQGTSGTTAVWLDTIDNCTISNNSIDTIPYAGIIFNNITNCTVSGNTVINTQNHGVNIGPGSGNITISHNTFKDCVLSGNTTHGGVRIYGGQLNGYITIEYNTITNCVNGIYQRNDLDFSAYPIAAHYNTITSNSNRSIFNATTSPEKGTIDAVNNWFGTNTGPYHPVSNVTGTGDRIDDYIAYSPWLTSEP